MSFATKNPKYFSFFSASIYLARKMKRLKKKSWIAFCMVYKELFHTSDNQTLITRDIIRIQY